ncbi:MAG TPA: DUF3052 domain-containing protein [Dehalococcoidia bacterium]
MGLEAQCRVTLQRDGAVAASHGKALLETSELLFRGDFRLRIPFAEARELNESGGVLTIAWPEGSADFELGPSAAKWADKIRRPRGLLDKLGIKPGANVCLIGVAEAAFAEPLTSRGARILPAEAAAAADHVFYAADEPAALAALASLGTDLKATGALWVVSPKGKGSPVRDFEVIDAARAAGLVDVKVVSFSDTRTALKFVIPVAQRAK